MYVGKHVLIYVWLSMCMCEYCVLCIFVCIVVSIYVSPHKCLRKVHKTSVCTFAFKLVPLGLALQAWLFEACKPTCMP